MILLRVIKQRKAESAFLSVWDRTAGHLARAALVVVVTGPLAYALNGTIVRTTLTSPALEGNAWGDSGTRNAVVYLPPGYDASSKRYPVAYYLHGGNGDEVSVMGGAFAADRLINEGMMQDMIVVGVDASNSYGFTFYVNSALLGNYEDFIVQDVVSYIDANFRTIDNRNSRGVFGLSSGGDGAMWFGMRHPDVFGAVYATSGSFFHVSQQDYHVNLGEDIAVFSDIVLDFANVTDPAAQLADVRSPADFANSNFEKLIYSLAAFHSPNLNNPELFVDLPFELPSLQVVPAVRDRWLENDQFRLLEEYAPNLSSLRGLAFDVGDRDQIGARQHSELFHQELLDAGVPHQFEVFPGGHGPARFEESLTFLSAALTIPEPSTLTVLLVCIGLTFLGLARAVR